MAGRTVEMGYLFYIELFSNGCFEEATAMRGTDLFRALTAIPLPHRKKWAPWFGYDFMIVANGARNTHSPESLELLTEIQAMEPDSIQLACDAEMDWKDRKKEHFTAKYWLHNVHRTGQDFYCGIDEQSIERRLTEIGGHPLQGLTKLSQITDDYACWDYIKTWLDRNWRTEEQIPNRPLKKIRQEFWPRLSIAEKIQ